MSNKKSFQIIKKATCFLMLIAVLTTFTGCASYTAAALGDISGSQFQLSNPTLLAAADPTKIILPNGQEATINMVENDYIQMVTKVYDDVDCKKYFDRDLLNKGYQPIQICIKNKSSKPFYISPDRINLPLEEPSQVARAVHTSTATRVTLYCIGGLFLSPLFIPAIVDGIKSSEANKILDYDFEKKALKSQTIQAHSKYNGVIFVSSENFRKARDLTVTLVNAENNKPMTLTNDLIF